MSLYYCLYLLFRWLQCNEKHVYFRVCRSYVILSFAFSLFYNAAIHKLTRLPCEWLRISFKINHLSFNFEIFQVLLKVIQQIDSKHDIYMILWSYISIFWIFDMCYNRATELLKSRFISRKQQSRHVQVFGQKFTCYSFCNYRVFLSISQIWHMKLYPCYLFLYRHCFYGFCFENKITTTNNLHKNSKIVKGSFYILFWSQCFK